MRSARLGVMRCAQAFNGVPFHGHSLHEHVEQATTMPIQDFGVTPNTTVFKMGYRRVDNEYPCLTFKHWGKARGLDAQGARLIKRGNTIEPVIGHRETAHRMDGCHAEGEMGNLPQAVQCAPRYRIRWLLWAIAGNEPKDLTLLFSTIVAIKLKRLMAHAQTIFLSAKPLNTKLVSQSRILQGR